MDDLLERPGSSPVLQQPGVHMGVNAPTWPAAGPWTTSRPKRVGLKPTRIRKASILGSRSPSMRCDSLYSVPVMFHTAQLEL
jgi:hypothetical protein